MFRALRQAIFGIDPPAPPGMGRPAPPGAAGSGWHPTSAQRAAFRAAHPMAKKRRPPPPPRRAGLGGSQSYGVQAAQQGYGGAQQGYGGAQQQSYSASQQQGGYDASQQYADPQQSYGAPAQAAPAVAMDPAALTALASQMPAAMQSLTSAAYSAQNALSSLASTSPTANAVVSSDDGDAAISGEMSIRHDPDGSVHIDHQPHGDIGCEGDVDFAGFAGDHYTIFNVEYGPPGEDPFGTLGNPPGSFGSEYEDDGLYNPYGPTAPISVEYHLSRLDSFGPTHSPYNFGLEGEEMVDTEGMPTGPVGDGPGSFGFDDEFFQPGGLAMIFGAAEDDDGGDYGMKG
jgi:hypothetical protein